MVAPRSFGVGVLEAGAIGRLVDALIADGTTVVAPALRDGVVALDEITSSDELATGVRAETAPGRYELVDDADGLVFGAIVGPDSPKRWRRPPTSIVWEGRRDGFSGGRPPIAERKMAFIGLRGCDLAAIRVYDRAVGYVPTDDFVVGFECTRPEPTCFCVSLGTGPGIHRDADLVVTEITSPSHVLVTRAYSERGAAMLARLGARLPTGAEEDAAWAEVAEAARSMVDGIDPDEAAAALRYPTAQGWEDVAERCVACGSCTLVCPTCFCTTTIDRTTSDGAATRVRVWDSCFSPGFAAVHGGPVRASIAARYRQWISHKLSWWWDQFGSSGCVGCGRCIVWCPAGIDIRDEVAAATERVSANV